MRPIPIESIEQKVKDIFDEIIEIIKHENTINKKQKNIISRYLNDEIKNLIKEIENQHEDFYIEKTYSEKLTSDLIDSVIQLAEDNFTKEKVLEYLLELALSLVMSISMFNTSYETHVKIFQLIDVINRVYSFIKNQENVIKNTIQEYKEMMISPMREFLENHKRDFLFWYETDIDFRNIVRDFIREPNSQDYHKLIQILNEKIKEKIEFLNSFEGTYLKNSNNRY